MNLQCPNCQVEYEVPHTRLTARVTARCSACDHSWTIGEDEDDEAGPTIEPDESEEPTGDEPLEPIALGEPSERLSPPLSAVPTPNRLLTAAWIASTAAIAASILTVCVYRATLVSAWPPAGRVFAANPIEPVSNAGASKP